MKSLKRFLFPTIFIIIYLALIATVFLGGNDISEIWATIGLQILLATLWWLALYSIVEIPKKHIFWVISIVWILLSLLARWFHTKQHGIFIFFTHIILLVYIWDWFHLTDSSKKFYLWRSSHRGLETTSLLLAITYTATLRWASTDITLNCDQLHDQTLWLITNYIPNIKDNETINSLIEKIDSIWSQSIGQALGTTNISSWTATLLLTWETPNNQFNSQSWLLSSILSYQQNFINWVVNNQELIDAQVCDITLQQINTIAEKSDIKLIAFVLLVLLVSFFMRSIMFIVGIINFIILWLLFKFKWFTKTETKEKVEKITM